MASALIVYGSTTGNTAYVAGVAQRVLESAGISTTLLDAANAEPDGLCKDYDMVLFGSSTWGDEEIELQDDFASLFEAFDNIGVSGKKAAVFGCGDSSYTWFCGAVDAIERRLGELGAVLVADSLKIDSDPNTEKEAIEDWAGQVAKAA